MLVLLLVLLVLLDLVGSLLALGDGLTLTEGIPEGYELIEGSNEREGAELGIELGAFLTLGNFALFNFLWDLLIVFFMNFLFSLIVNASVS